MVRSVRTGARVGEWEDRNRVNISAGLSMAFLSKERMEGKGVFPTRRPEQQIFSG